MPLDAILGGVGDVAGYFFGGDDRARAADILEQMKKGYAGLNPTIAAQEAGPSAVTRADPSTRAAQLDALAEFERTYRGGGLDPVAKANLATIEQESEREGRSQQAGVMADAARRGMAGAGTAIVSQQVAGQNATNAAQNAALQQGAIAEQGRRAAVTGAAGVAGQVRGQDYERAAAEDAINAFNARQRQGAQEQTFQNSYARQGGIAGAQGAQYGQAMDDSQRLQRLFGGLGRAAGGVGDYFIKPGGV